LTASALGWGGEERCPRTHLTYHRF
jgi:hypothetical protein